MGLPAAGEAGLLALPPGVPSGGIADVFVAEPTNLRPARDRLAGWLATVPLAGHQLDVVLAVHETAANAIEHARGTSEAGTVRIEARVVGPELVVVVADSGTWRDPSAGAGARTGGAESPGAQADGCRRHRDVEPRHHRDDVDGRRSRAGQGGLTARPRRPSCAGRASMAAWLPTWTRS